MNEAIRAVQLGCGPIGCSLAALAVRRNDLALVGAVDIDPGKVGKDLAELLGLDEPLGVVVTDDVGALLSQHEPRLAFHATGSAFCAVFDQIAAIVAAGVNVVSTCEELSFPSHREPALAAELDRLAKRHGVSVLATGINPGFLMDTWPLCMTAPCQRVESIRAVRVQDASRRRLPFVRKIGAGATLEQFAQRVDAGDLRHVGLTESVAMIAAGLGWELTEVTEEIEPIIAEQEVASPQLTVRPGQVAGVRQLGRGWRGDREVVTLEFSASVGAPESYDAVFIRGEPSLEVVIRGGVHGDLGTAAVAVNAARRVVAAPPGLLTMPDIPLVTCAAG